MSTKIEKELKEIRKQLASISRNILKKREKAEKILAALKKQSQNSKK